MRVKKSIFGCMIWIVFVGILVAAMIQNVSVFFVKIPQTMWMTEGLILACIFVAAIGILLIARNISFRIQKVQKKRTPNVNSDINTRAKTLSVIEILGVIALCCLIFGIRIFYMFNLIQGSSPMIENEYYTAALVGNSYDAITYSTLSNVYISILSILFSLLGNKAVFGICFQLILQGIGILFIYFMVRNINGKMNAFLIAAVLAVWKPIITSSMQLSPAHVLFFLFVVMMWYMTAVWKAVAQEKSNLILRVVFILFAGIVTGLSVYLDLSGVVLFVTGIAGLLLCRSSVSTAESKMKKNVIPAATGYILSSIVSFLVFLFLESMVTGTDPVSTFSAFLNARIGNFYFQMQPVFPVMQLELSMGILFLTASWVVGYWLAKKDENLFYILWLSGTLLCSLFVHGEINYAPMVPVSWIFVLITAVTSLCTCYTEKQPEREEESVKKEDTVKEQVPVKTEEIPMKMEESVKEEIPVKKEDPAVNTFVPIPNPLPLPKQHVHREMDYAMKVDESLMHYDLESVSDEDDYDLK